MDARAREDGDGDARDDARGRRARWARWARRAGALVASVVCALYLVGLAVPEPTTTARDDDDDDDARDDDGREDDDGTRTNEARDARATVARTRIEYVPQARRR